MSERRGWAQRTAKQEQPRLGGDPLVDPAQPKVSWVDPREWWENR